MKKIKILKVKNDKKEIEIISIDDFKRMKNESELFERFTDSQGINYLYEFYRNKKNDLYFLTMFNLKTRKYENLKGGYVG